MQAGKLAQMATNLAIDPTSTERALEVSGGRMKRMASPRRRFIFDLLGPRLGPRCRPERAAALRPGTGRRSETICVLEPVTCPRIDSTLGKACRAEQTED